ncbi:hypothetical protein ACFQBS_36040 [Planomonospora parontospora]|uniref:hypothetical protein n=1 Tax=Planomonospora parontospora TaxID=58119 RepID=UPI00361E1E19
MIETTEQHSEAGMCRYPGCPAPPAPAPADKPGRRPSYCVDANHTPLTAYRERQRLKKAAVGDPSAPTPEDLDRPVSLSQVRAGELVGRIEALAVGLE